MTLRLYLVRETAGARLYERKNGTRRWIPRSVVTRTLKFPPQPAARSIHEIDVADWWMRQNPWPDDTQAELGMEGTDD